MLVSLLYYINTNVWWETHTTQQKNLKYSQTVAFKNLENYVKAYLGSKNLEPKPSSNC